MSGNFDYVKPKTLTEALEYLDRHGPESKLMAGGTDLLVLVRRNLAMPAHVVDVKGIAETGRLEFIPGQGLFIGASVTVNEVALSEAVKERYPALAQAAGSLASYQLRNRATLVGNICNASPGADLAPPLLVFEAVVHIVSLLGSRTVPVAEFFTGVKKTVLRQEEMVIGVSLPEPPPGDRSLYLKQARIKGHDLGIVGVAARLTGEKKFHLAMSSVAPTPIRLFQLEQTLNARPLSLALAERAGEEARRWIHPISDVRSSAEYRTHVAGVLVKRAVARLISGEGTYDA